MANKVTINWEGTFDAAHFIPGHPKCGRLHGHTYTVRVRATGSLSLIPGQHPYYLWDYGEIKKIVNELDHKILLPAASVCVVLSHEDSQVSAVWVSTQQDHNSLNLAEAEVAIVQERDTSAECLVSHLLRVLSEAAPPLVERIEVTVSETAKTSAEGSCTRIQS
jgi:6-pyruvoyltetrahydropterin/6-carboxytetrahydropterin synthase